MFKLKLLDLTLPLAIMMSVSGTTAQAWSLKEAAAPYKGQTIHIVCEGYPPCYALQKISKEFTKETKIKVKFEFGDLLAITQRILSEQISESEYFDGMQVLSYYLPLFGEQNFYTPMSRFLDDPKLRNPSFNSDDFVAELYRQSTTYKGKQLALPFQSLVSFAVMRKDVLRNPEERATFKAKYGYELPAANHISKIDTYQQWLDMAEFFTRPKGAKLAGKTLKTDFYGGSAPFKRHLTVFWTFWATLVANGGEIYDSNGKVVLDVGTAAVDSLQWMLDLSKFSPPSYREYTWDDEYREFCAGNIFSLTYWPDASYYLEDAKDCMSSGNITYLPLPNTHKSMPFTYSFLISPQSKHPEAAFLLQQWALSKAKQDAVTGLGWVSSMRKDVIAEDWSGNVQISGSMQLANKLSKAGYFYTPPGHPAMIASQDIFMDELSAAGAGQIDAATAISNIANRLRKLTNK